MRSFLETKFNDCFFALNWLVVVHFYHWGIMAFVSTVFAVRYTQAAKVQGLKMMQKAVIFSLKTGQDMIYYDTTYMYSHFQ